MTKFVILTFEDDKHHARVIEDIEIALDEMDTHLSDTDDFCEGESHDALEAAYKSLNTLAVELKQDFIQTADRTAEKGAYERLLAQLSSDESTS